MHLVAHVGEEGAFRHIRRIGLHPRLLQLAGALLHQIFKVVAVGFEFIGHALLFRDVLQRGKYHRLAVQLAEAGGHQAGTDRAVGAAELPFEGGNLAGALQLRDDPGALPGVSIDLQFAHGLADDGLALGGGHLKSRLVDFEDAPIVRSRNHQRDRGGGEDRGEMLLAFA